MRLTNTKPPPPRNAAFYITKLCTIAVCVYVLKMAKLAEVMLRSRKIIQPVMLLSYASFAIFVALWFYTGLVVKPKHPNWSETHKGLLHTAAGAWCAGGFLWAVAVWPVFHIWTIPLGLVSLVLFLNLVAIIPSFSRKEKE
ncbi:uncharacterized protein TEOVI_000841800 [Trypanosoma equiperdum]|uniref:Transmembrane protein n=2 Tax=Trypanozoon TaxID=39700 RepID=Q38AI2_TRYB2|nr:hypothetical protein, conserved [Trypanosoma brucei brucei TREU927]EAN78188.1 hypothetical protein, conserved [Trypanosoma brucei brucei TREU927]SCU64629.1 hypothetical protein, conserved [Trypanosoma equiperdum]